MVKSIKCTILLIRYEEETCLHSCNEDIASHQFVSEKLTSYGTDLCTKEVQKTILHRWSALIFGISDACHKQAVPGSTNLTHRIFVLIGNNVS